jgi:hypothetical protein
MGIRKVNRDCGCYVGVSPVTHAGRSFGGEQSTSSAATTPGKVAKGIKKKGEKDKNILYSRREDGTYVRCVLKKFILENMLTNVFTSLECPECHKTNFANQQGFINHCRIVHKLDFGNHEKANLMCGVPVVRALMKCTFILTDSTWRMRVMFRWTIRVGGKFLEIHIPFSLEGQKALLYFCSVTNCSF